MLLAEADRLLGEMRRAARGRLGGSGNSGGINGSGELTAVSAVLSAAASEGPAGSSGCEASGADARQRGLPAGSCNRCSWSWGKGRRCTWQGWQQRWRRCACPAGVRRRRRDGYSLRSRRIGSSSSSGGGRSGSLLVPGTYELRFVRLFNGEASYGGEGHGGC